MAIKKIIDLITGNQNEVEIIPVDELNGVLVDASLSYDHSYSANVTNHEVEEGYEITDHVKNNPNKFTLTGIISECHPSMLDVAVNLAAGIASRKTTREFGTIGQQLAPAVAIGSSFIGKSGKTKTLEAQETLTRYIEKNVILNINTTKVTHENMILESISFKESKDIADSVKFTAEFKKIKVVSELFFKLLPSDIEKSVSARAKNATKKGVQSTIEKAAKSAVPKSSIAYGLASSLGIL